MSERKNLFTVPYPLIGVVHLPPLPGFDGCPGFAAVLDKAWTEVQTLEQAGFDGALIENEGDRPHPLIVDEEYRGHFTELMMALKQRARIPLGLEILYDMVSTVRVGIDSQADFVRLDVFTDDTETRWGVVKACVEEVRKLRAAVKSEGPLLLADIHVKHGKNLTSRTLAESGKLALSCGADGLIVTGTLTGIKPSDEDCQTLRAVAGHAPLFVGSGFAVDNAKQILSWCSGAIVASSIKIGDSIDFQKATWLRELVETLR